MSSTFEGFETTSSGFVGRNGKKPERNRRSWTLAEEAVLIAGMKELIAEGWKSDNGFKVGYLNKLEEIMKKSFPSTDLKGSPHINSRLGSWKKNYYSLSQILSRSGVGFNLKGNHTIDVEDDQWEQIVKLDSNTRLMRYKSWPYFEQWKEIFGKDLANGEGAEDALDAVNAGKDDEAAAFELHENGLNCNIDETPGLEDEGESESQSKKSSHTSSKSKGKKRIASEMQGLIDVLSMIGEKTDASLSDLAKRVGYEYDLGAAQQEAFDNLASIPDLSVDEKFDVCEILGKTKYELEIFIGLRGEARAMYVQRLLKNRGI